MLVIDWLRDGLEWGQNWWQATFIYKTADSFESFCWGLWDSITDGIAVPLNYVLEETIESLTWMLEFVG